MIKFITDYQAGIIGVVFFTLLILSVLIFTDVIGSRSRNKLKNDKQSEPTDKLKRYTKVGPDF